MGRTGMAIAAGHVEIEAVAALVLLPSLRRVGSPTIATSGRQVGLDIGDHARRAEATQFLVIAEREMDGALQACRLHLRHQG